MMARAAPLIIHCDCEYACSGVNAMIPGTPPPAQKYAAAWAAVHRILCARSGATTIRKVRAHQTHAQLHAA